MEAAASTTAPAQSVQPGPASESPIATTASERVIASGDVAAYREARRHERAPEVQARAAATTETEADPDANPATAAAPGTTPATSAPEPRTVSKRQQQINDYERSIAALKAENARLKSTTTATPAAARPATGSESSASSQSAAAGPTGIPVDIGHPALEEAAFYTKHPEASTADYFRYLTRFDREVERATDRMRQSQTAEQAAAHERATKFHAQITAAGDPTVVMARIDPELIELETRASAMAKGQRPTAANDLADEILGSEVALQVLEHLTAQPAIKAKLLASPDRRTLLREFARLETQFSPAAANAAASPKTITDAPAPAVTLGSRAAHPGDPVESAVASGDVSAYRAARLRERAAQLR
jgi:hypothetical protein